MKRSREAILADLDLTLDQLIENAKILDCDTSSQYLYENEVDALQKMQESLLAHLIHLDQLLEINSRKKHLLSAPKSQSFQNKFAEFSKLNTNFMNALATRFEAKPKKSFKKSPARRRSKETCLV